MRKLIVPNKYENKKLSVFLLNTFTNLNKNTFYKALRKKDIKINQKRISQDLLLHEDDEVSIYISDSLLENNFDLSVFYEDKNILIINKPPQIEVLGNNSLTSKIWQSYENCSFKPKPCHRLDRNTCGLILYAKTNEAYEILLQKFRQKEIEKHYLSLVYGKPNFNNTTKTAFLFKDTKKSKVYISNSFKKGYQKIITTFTTLEHYSNGTSLLDVELQTGKTHQIRAHLSYLGYPIIGDGKYGKNEINKKFGCKYQNLCSYILKFNFKEHSGILEYLNGKEFKLSYSFQSQNQKKSTI